MEALTHIESPKVIQADAPVAPFSNELITITKQEYIKLSADVGYWKSRHRAATEKIESLTEELEKYKAKVRALNQRIFGKKTEKKTSSEKLDTNKQTLPRNRGQQSGKKGHGRTKRPHLPVVEEIIDLRDEDKSCLKCGVTYLAFGEEESEIVEVEVKAHTRKIKRQRYKQGCQCDDVQKLIIAPRAPKVIPKSSIGVSIWVETLLDKYWRAIPLSRTTQKLKEIGLPISSGTLVGGLQKLAVVFVPLLSALHKKQMTEHHFHADETRWEVFEKVEGKEGSRWYLWLFTSDSVVYYQMDPSRSAEVPKGHFAELDKELPEVFLVCDRYSAYKCFIKGFSMIVLAFCWAHVRRDFLVAAKSYPALKDWGFEWVEMIAELYHINNARVEAWSLEHTLETQSDVFNQKHKELKDKLSEMKEKREESLKEEAQTPADKLKKKVLTSLGNHWSGLTVFVDHPKIPMDNNIAERKIRPAVIGRKNYYGSRSVWSANFTAMMMSLLQTMHLWKLNTRHWLQAYLQACAEHGGKAPENLTPFLPWEMDEARLGVLKKPPPIGSS